ncbi:tRNA isopentenyltransferase [Dothidotthia symphoricarpi CBS 119687]|uniref:tRNA dimethylallyltransferase n=1 Tax=Dothidotthia symphoricarpi CBS 119687 TaxID=1392245 RepID=A0A6A6A7G8_9PLEO|nr:tRNA isopentenyltransferase [Dothidotthia symphoricarpi CBS 119687]KAF2127014.1 tRNA isopentenyltransferase [Dothidotthia symphoricarpi CBS 119687]
MAQAPLKPLIAIVGATGTGKSDLAVAIARKFNGEVVNGDAMQLYRGLPIITNKITQDEMMGIPHHLLGCISLDEETWTVGKFVGEALGVIEEIRSRGKLPILVGGTHYYTQSLLFQDALADESALDLKENSRHFPILDEPTEKILAELKEVDPVMADRWHPNERRKIQRSLEIYLRTGKPASQIYDEQRRSREVPPGPDGAMTSSSSGLRFPTLLFWVHTNKDVLYPRLDARVDKMINRGLLSEVQELTNFRKSYEARTGTLMDQSRGIWVSIGYKEFLDYQQALSQDAPDLEKTSITAIEKTQAATRQYASRQIKWIRIKLLNALFGAGQKSKIFLVDGSDLARWNEQITSPATSITEQFLSGQPLPDPCTLSPAAAEMLTPKRAYDLGQRPDLWQKRVCESCGTVAVTENDWELHIKSRTHRRAVGVKKKRENTKESLKQDRTAVQPDLVDVFESYMETFPHDGQSNQT